MKLKLIINIKGEIETFNYILATFNESLFMLMICQHFLLMIKITLVIKIN